MLLLSRVSGLARSGPAPARNAVCAEAGALLLSRPSCHPPVHAQRIRLLSTSVPSRAVLSNEEEKTTPGGTRAAKTERKARTEHARLASEQKRILADLRSAAELGSRSGGDVVKGLRDEQVLRGVARAALSGTGSGTGPMSMGMLGSTGANMPHTRPSRLDRWTGAGQSWSDISSGQKVARGAVNSSRFGFITAGALFTALVTWAIVTELFAKNSPTVVYENACKLVEKSEEVHGYLLQPYTFYTSETELTPDTALPVGRNRMRSVTSQLLEDPNSGEEIMRIRFVVHARDKEEDLTYFQRTREAAYAGVTWTKDRLLQVYDDALDWYDDYVASQSDDPERAQRAQESKKQRHASVLQWEQHESELAQPPAERWYHVPGRWLGAGMSGFVGLTRGAGATVRSATRAQEAGTWTTGEVHGELRKDGHGTFQFAKLFVDVPNSDAFSRRRAWIVRHVGDVQR